MRLMGDQWNQNKYVLIENQYGINEKEQRTFSSHIFIPHQQPPNWISCCIS